MNKLILNISAILIFTTLSATSVFSQKIFHITVERTYILPAEKIWAHIAEDYGAIANSHPAVIILTGRSRGVKVLSEFAILISLAPVF